jgi:uncharacterized protein YjbI with pentapeptide repeats
VVFTKISPLLISWIFTKCTIAFCDFSHLDIKKSQFLDCEIRETDFLYSNLTGSDFRDSDLNTSKFNNTNLEKTNFIGAKNYYIDPTCNKLKQARFSYPDVLSLLDPFGIKVE